MLNHRVIPALLLRNGGLVKTQRFKDPKYVGDPINAIRIFNEKEVDELMVLDITASKEKREPDYMLIEQFAGECFMPLAYGGGVRTVQQAQRIFASGVEKICIQTAALDNLQLVRELADRFGSQSIMVSLDIKKNWLARAQAFATSWSLPWPQNHPSMHMYCRTAPSTNPDTSYTKGPKCLPPSAAPPPYPRMLVQNSAAVCQSPAI